MTSSKNNSTGEIESANSADEARAEGPRKPKAGVKSLPKVPKLPVGASLGGGKANPRSTLSGIGAALKELRANDGAPQEKRNISLPIPRPLPLKSGGGDAPEESRDAVEPVEIAAAEVEALDVVELEAVEIEPVEIAASEIEAVEGEALEIVSLEEVSDEVSDSPQTDRMSADEVSWEADPATIPIDPDILEGDFEGEATMVSESPLLDARVDALEHAAKPLRTRTTSLLTPTESGSPAPLVEIPPADIGVVEPVAASPAPTSVEVADDDFEGEKTEVFDSPFEHEVLSARLSVLSGPCAGQEFLLNRERNTLGRGQNNSIVLSDLAMSRQHFEVRQNAEHGYLLLDLQSANGTRLNHTPIVEAELRHGDRVEAGKSEFQFVLPGDRAPARSQQRHIIIKRAAHQPRRSQLVQGVEVQAHPPSDADRLDVALTWVIRGAGVLIALLIITMVVLTLTSPERAPVIAEVAPAPSELSPEAQRVQSLYLEGVEKVKDRDWPEASRLFKQVAAIDADFAGVGAQLERVKSEQQVSEQLDTARALLAEQKYPEVIEIASAITNRSVYVEDAHRLLREAKQHRIAGLLQQAQQALSDEAFDQARAHLAVVLEEVPNHQGALELQALLQGDADKIAEKVEEIEQEQARETARRPVAKPANSQPKIDWFGEKKTESNDLFAAGDTKAAVQINFTRGFSLYRSGKLSQASSYFRDAASGSAGALARRATQTADNIDAFAKVHGRAKAALGANDWATAVEQLNRAHQADRKVASKAYFKSSLNADLATAYANIGLAAVARADFKTAGQNYKKGYKLQSRNAALSSLSRELSRRSNTLYIQAAGKRKKDPAGALKLCQEIVSMLAPHHELYGKAKAMMAELK
ncbi:FHA domain-containing protein [Bradymonas sediminis]|uniref:Uncharacterized protein n=1 Tax=Bradymonas sediminis TaxID=1548548 RepID=A0A2Z4FFZ4_9DELT|nr:FHA domain-containing protein [Bradymonas sediminis]AWV87833.1 hypothetical protein DN745_00180 [Bradymonas sediminis]TDP73928.1 type III secretion system (T3SS) inner membrane Yop/YscD-like protein [Bradymonas sediminis]